MLPEYMNCQKCGSNFLLDENERKTGRFKCSICEHVNIFNPNNPGSYKQQHIIQDYVKYTCGNCNTEVEQDAEYCQDCGVRFKSIQNHTRTTNCVFCNTRVVIGDNTCYKCGALLSGNKTTFNPSPNYESLATQFVNPNDQKYDFSFTGDAKEYFKIWIINLVLTIFTFGIYAAWAKVRTRKYFYSSTWLAGDHFDYKANPKGILIGYLILGILIFLYYFTNFINPLLSLITIGAGALILPYLIYKSYRFFAHNSSYRNLRFSFHGTAGDSYVTYLLIPLGIPVTLGLIYPFWDFSRKKYSYSNFGFGNLRSNFFGKASTFYKHYLIIGGLMFVYGIVGMLGIGGVIAVTNFEFGISSGFDMVFYYIMILTFYQFGLMLYNQYLFSRLINYSLGQTTFNKIRISSTLQFRELFVIQFTNLLAIVFTLGLMIPWAKVRRAKYIFNNISIVTDTDLDNIEADNTQENNALGNVTTDYFELNIGL